jgi:hypothetical protein
MEEKEVALNYVHVEGTEIPAPNDMELTSTSTGSLEEFKKALKDAYRPSVIYRYNMNTVLNKQKAMKNKIAKRRAKNKK